MSLSCVCGWMGGGEGGKLSLRSHTHIHTNTHTHTHHMHARVHSHTHTHTLTHTHTRTHARTHARTYVRTHTYIHRYNPVSSKVCNLIFYDGDEDEVKKGEGMSEFSPPVGASSGSTRAYLLGGSLKLVCTSECPLYSFAQEVARGRRVTSGPFSE